MPEVGPFGVDPAQVAGLSGGDFVAFVGALLDAELARGAVLGATLDITHRENIGDAGVDATLRLTAGSRRIPSGESAWQFKAGDLPPAAAATELSNSAEARRILTAGGTYRLVLGASLTPVRVANRRAALEDKARDLGLTVADGTFDVIAGDRLASWAQDFPALAVSPLIRGPGPLGQTFDEWAASNRHVTRWVSSDARDDQIELIRTELLEGRQIDLHISGVSGLGKTRTVLEALRGRPESAVVLYVPSADQFPSAYLNHLASQHRTAVVVIDECDPRLHEVYASALPEDSAIRLITMSEPTDRSTRSPMVGLARLDDEAIQRVLRVNEPGLSWEAIRVIADVSAGNVDFALKSARAFLARRIDSAGTLVSPEDIRQFIVDELPGGALFLASAALALFGRVGFDAEVADELTLISQALGIAEQDLRSAAAALSEKGLIDRQGRYRAVAPHPVAIYLASAGWTEFGNRIVTDLLPILDDDLRERLFRRAGEIGDAGLISQAVDAMLAQGGPVATLEQLAERQNGSLLEHVAILSPDRTLRHIEALLDGLADADLLGLGASRRSLIWTLQKLAWRSNLFEPAADLLLRLAINESESYSNNSSGVWVDLFGTMLPATAAEPATRISYLLSLCETGDERAGVLVTRAAGHALAYHESIISGPELQGGVVVERRGTPRSPAEALEYKASMLDLLARLAAQSNPVVAEPALKELLDAAHPVLETEPLRRHLTDLITGLDPAQQLEARRVIVSLSLLFNRVGDEGVRAQAVAEMLDTLPAPSPRERLWLATHVQPWSREGQSAGDAIERALDGLDVGQAEVALLDALQEQLPAAYEVGRQLARITSDAEHTAQELSGLVDSPNGGALIGFLLQQVDDGATDAFDDFLGASALAPSAKLAIASRGPRTSRSDARIAALIHEVPVAVGARNLFFWVRDADTEQSLSALDSWLSRLDSQEDYNAVVDLVALLIHDVAVPAPELAARIRGLVEQRAHFPNLGQQEWDWDRLAATVITEHPDEIARLIASLVEADAMSTHGVSKEESVFRQAVEAASPEVWADLVSALGDRGRWKLSFATRGWLSDAIDPDKAKAWIGTSVERARLVARGAEVNPGPLSPLVVFLLQQFADDERIASSLYADLVSGFWTGNESDRITTQIDAATAWAAAPYPSGVRSWARDVLVELRARLAVVLQDEAEGDF